MAPDLADLTAARPTAGGARRPGRARRRSGRWWFQRDWTDTGAPLHETIRVSYSKLSTLENCELQYVLSAELGLGGMVGYQAWVGRPCTRSSRTARTARRAHAREAEGRGVDVRWRPQEFPSTAVSETWRRLARRGCCRTGSVGSASTPRPAPSAGSSSTYDGVTLNGYIDRIGPDPLGFGTRITDYKTGGTYDMPKANESLQLGIYYLAVAGGART